MKTIEYRVADPSYWGDAPPLEELFKWAVAHGAQESFLNVLSETLFRWSNQKMSKIFHICAPGVSNTFYFGDGESERLEHGDFVLNNSLVDKEAGYRRDRICVFKWIDSKRKWQLTKEHVVYYARQLPFVLVQRELERWQG